MHHIHIAIVVAGMAISLLLVYLYYWGQDKVTKSLVSTLAFGLLLGLLTVAALNSSYWVYSVIMAAYISYFIYLKEHSYFNKSTESTMASLFAGSVIGVFGLAGCIVCA